MTGIRGIPLFLLALSLMAWHDPVHELITRAAIQSLPQALQQQWAAEIPQLTGRYCLYPDMYANADAAEKARLRLFCEVGDRPIHNVTWKRAEDLESLEYLLRCVWQLYLGSSAILMQAHGAGPAEKAGE
jgi:hypothetical protein